MKAPLIKVFLARYVLILEIGGYLALCLLIGGIVYSTFYMVDDVCKISADAAVTPRTEIITLEKISYIRDVYAREGNRVEKGSPLFSIAAHTVEFDTLVSLRRYFDQARRTLDATTATLAESGALSDLLQQGIKATDRLRAAPTINIASPMAGDLEIISKNARPLWQLAGEILEGPVARVLNYGSLRFSVPVSGKNADRVRINQLAVDDVLDWKALTRSIRAKSAPASAAERRVWERLRGKLPEVRPNRVPPKNRKADVVQALAEILEAPDFYDPTVWSSSQIAEEERTLVQRGIPNLTFEDRVRLNRLLFEGIFPDAVAKSRNKRVPVKARILIQVTPTPESRGAQAPETKVFPMTGEVITERQGGNVTVQLPNPNAELVGYLRKCLADPSKPAPDFRGSIIVDRISAFRFLFRKG